MNGMTYFIGRVMVVGVDKYRDGTSWRFFEARQSHGPFLPLLWGTVRYDLLALLAVSPQLLLNSIDTSAFDTTTALARTTALHGKD